MKFMPVTKILLLKKVFAESYRANIVWVAAFWLRSILSRTAFLFVEIAKAWIELVPGMQAICPSPGSKLAILIAEGLI